MPCPEQSDSILNQAPEDLIIIAGSGRYPLLLAEQARAKGVQRLYAAAFEGETDPGIDALVDGTRWMRVGQLGKLIDACGEFSAKHAIMAGQITPSNLFNLRPDMRALMLLARVKRRNAESLFGAVAKALSEAGVEILPATTCLEDYLADEGHFAGPRPKQRQIDDVEFGFEIAKDVARLDIGQTVVVRNGTVLAVEAFEGTNETIRRGGALSRESAVVVKVSKPNQDFRFDVPVIGMRTLEVAAESKIRVIGMECDRTLLLDRDELFKLADRLKIALIGVRQ